MTLFAYVRNIGLAVGITALGLAVLITGASASEIVLSSLTVSM